ALAGLALLLRARPSGRAIATLAVLGLVAVSRPAAAQSPYSVGMRMETFVPRTTGGTPLHLAFSDDDDAPAMLPFSFRFFGTDYTSLLIGTNGYVTFGTDGSEYTNDSFPSSFDPNAVIAVWWDDLDTTSATSFVEGTAPSRKLILQWEGSRRHNAQGSIPMQ